MGVSKGKRRFAIFFTKPIKVKGSKPTFGGKHTLKVVATRTATGHVAAYRAATGWKGPVYKAEGHLRQAPIARVKGYVKPGSTDEMTPDQRIAAYRALPPMAYVVEIGGLE